jgi:putative tricarboxylic transport membrane protein
MLALWHMQNGMSGRWHRAYAPSAVLIRGEPKVHLTAERHSFEARKNRHDLMHKRDLCSSLFFLGVAILVIIGSFQYPIQDRYGPGAGFFPLLLGGALLGLSLTLFFNSVLIPLKKRGPAPSQSKPQTFSDIGRVGIYLGFLLLFYILFDRLGYFLTITLFMAFVLKFLTKRSLKFSISISALTALFVFLVFVNLLGVPLPEGILEYFF